MPCGEHACPRNCHEGLCGSCEVSVESRCYCGKVQEPIPCSERDEEKQSHVIHEFIDVYPEAMSLSTDSGSTLCTTTVNDTDLEAKFTVGVDSVDSWIGSFTCKNSCKRSFDCGKHSCLRGCHEQTANSPHCPLSPDIVKHCPCGKTSLASMECERKSCDDAVPHCEEVCNKTLSCGHLCLLKCHSGGCAPCFTTTSIKCRCGRTSSTTVCHQGVEEPPQCTRSCRALLNCGRHECGERCCPAEKVASDRQAAKRKMRSLNAPQGNTNDFEAEHICTRVCGRPLKCGDEHHTCQELCHRGPCGSCREAIFDELACNCGRTVLQPPLPCGTKPPACRYPCRRSKACGHPIVKHECHEDEVCPKCPYLVAKACMCGKSTLKNQPCWSTQISCGQSCGRKLKCGIHFCEKTCHREGECEDVGSRSCPQTCGQKKIECEHFCLASCHAPYSCKEDKPCQSKIIITCDCGRIKQERKCLVFKADSGSSTRKPLECDDECLRLIRNWKLAQALNVDPEQANSDHIPYSSTTLDMFQEDVKWSQKQEREFRVFAADDTEKRLRFKPMKSHQRAFLHALAEDFGFDSESLDPEPHRHVIIFKTPRFVSAPMKTLSQCRTKPALPVVAASSKAVETGKPYNALLLTSPRFALTLDELRSHLHEDFEKSPNHTFNISFLPSEEIVIHLATSDLSHRGTEIDVNTLTQLKSLVLTTVNSQLLASSVAMCRIDQSLNVERRENDSSKEGGWSQVVKGASAKTRVSGLGVGAKSSFTVLGTKASKPHKEETVVENWESAVDSWE
jgi:transcriptional repressor NF-X1